MHPYAQQPDKSFWKRFVSPTSWRELSLFDPPKFRLTANDKIATAGSCFAQNIARHMRNKGLQPYIAETAHPITEELGENTDSYRQFSARYGNIYTPRQAVELFWQAFGAMPIIHDYAMHEGRYFDLLRPNLLPEGFASITEAEADRCYHIDCVRRMFENADIFIFTLGLTECWLNAEGGYAYPVCPGTVRGQFDPVRHIFHNFNHAEVLADIETLIAGLKAVNSGLRLILTVSPVPLVATHTQQNVLLASNYSKAVLRAVCGELESRHPNVQYFPAYEIISHPASFGQYLESDLRGVTERGIAHVMDCFFSSFYDHHETMISEHPAATSTVAYPNMERLLNAECEEVFNDIHR